MTAVLSARLQAAFLVALLLACGAPASARQAPVRVLVGTQVSDSASASMPPQLWGKLVADYVNAQAIPFNGTPKLDDCHKAGADFMLDAPFELRPRLPGMPNSSGRVAARTHLVITNCLTETVAQDVAINFDSDPASQNEGDFESSPQITWSRNVPAALAKHPVFFPRVSRVLSLNAPFATIDSYEGAKIGDVLRIYADANRRKKGPVYMTVSALNGKTLDVFFSQAASPQPAAGDFVEPAPKQTP
ncbi:MAG: hypothetical protein GIW95_09525 [Candidatus Eremiobacteraeota bacterium]|nr:hypothetical protein [Candidatus Eremiobacteraeota bacterium]